MKALIVEDDSMTRKAIEHSLKLDGFIVVTAENATNAMEILRVDDIDVLLTDIHMPHISGLDLVVFVRNELHKNLPIIIVTRVGAEETIMKAFELGADDYITKPFVPTELSLRIKKALLKTNNKL